MILLPSGLGYVLFWFLFVGGASLAVVLKVLYFLASYIED